MVTDADSWGLGVGVGGLVAAMAATGVAGGGCRDGGGGGGYFTRGNWVQTQACLTQKTTLSGPYRISIR